MKAHRISLVSLVCFTLMATAAFAQSAAPGGATPAQGFNVNILIMKLGLYLPEDKTQAMYGGFGGRGAGQAAPGAGGTQAQGAGGGTQAGQQRPQLQFTRDPKLFLTKDQIAKLIPIVSGLRDNPMPSPSKARQVQSDVDAILTAGQKAEYDQFQKAMDKFRQSRQQASGQTGGQQPPDFANMTDQQRQDYINSLPADQRQRFQNRAGQAGAAGGLTPLQRRQRQMDAFIKVLQDQMKTLG